VSKESIKFPLSPLFQSGENAPFEKGGGAKRRGILCPENPLAVVGCGATKSGNLLSSKLDAELTHEGTASIRSPRACRTIAIDAVRKLTTSYGSTSLTVCA